ncbi:MAG: SCO family protein [Nocardioidaceae bacterium]
MPLASPGPRLGAAGLAVLLALLAGCGGATPRVVRGDDDGMHGAVLTEQYTAPDVDLTDTDGKPFSLSADTDKPLTLVFFGYTHCPDICPMTMANLASAMARLDDGQRSRVDVVFVTTDPARDDEATIRGWLDRFDPSFLGLTGDLGTIKQLGKAFGVYIAQGRKLPSGGYEVTHGTPVVAIDADDRSPIVWTEGTSAADFADDIATLLEEAP